MSDRIFRIQSMTTTIQNVYFGVSIANVLRFRDSINSIWHFPEVKWTPCCFWSRGYQSYFVYREIVLLMIYTYDKYVCFFAYDLHLSTMDKIKYKALWIMWSNGLHIKLHITFHAADGFPSMKSLTITSSYVTMSAIIYFVMKVHTNGSLWSRISLCQL